MVKLNRTTEYGLLAISYIRSKTEAQNLAPTSPGSNGATSAREIAEHFDLPFEILAKTLQRLKDQGIISSTYGTRGGYVLSRDLNTLNLAEFLGMMEGPINVVSCVNHESEPQSEKPACEYRGHCTIKGMMSSLNYRIYDFLSRISVEELTRSSFNMAGGTSAGASIKMERPVTNTPMHHQGEEP